MPPGDMPFGLWRSSAWRHADGSPAGDRTPAAFPGSGTARCLFRHMPSDPWRVERPGRVLTAPRRATGPRRLPRVRHDAMCLRAHGIRPVADRVGGCARAGLDRVQPKVVRLLACSPRMRTDGDASWGSPTRKSRRNPLKSLERTRKWQRRREPAVAKRRRALVLAQVLERAPVDAIADQDLALTVRSWGRALRPAKGRNRPC